MTPLVSILIPAYNARKWIADAIFPAAAQNWKRKEIIIVVDGSADETLHVARGFASKSILVTAQPNQGAAAAHNHAFSLSQGDYIQWLDADDLLAPTKVSSQMEGLDHDPPPRTLLSEAWGAFFFRTERARFSPSPLWCNLTPTEWLIRKMTTGAHTQTANWLVSRERFDLPRYFVPLTWRGRIFVSLGFYRGANLLPKGVVRFLKDSRKKLHERRNGEVRRSRSAEASSSAR